VRLAAVATTDPLDRRTFSGYSAGLFGALADRGVPLVPLSSRHIGPIDLARGAVRLSALPRLRSAGRRVPIVNPAWYWSRSSAERCSRLVSRRLAARGGATHVLQVGTHVVVDAPGVRRFCVTDCTVPQAVAAGEFSVSHANGRVLREAVEWQAKVFASSEAVFTLSEWAAASVVEDYRVPPQRVQVVGAGANITGERRRAVDPARPIALFVGTDWALKGGPVLGSVWPRIRAAVPGARLVVVGCSPDLRGDGVEVVGRLEPNIAAERGRLLDLYSRASCLVMTSDFDAYPNVLLEAALMGVPAVGFDEQSRAEVIEDGVTGILVADRSTDALAAAVVRFLSSPADVLAMGEAARQRAVARHTWPVVAARVAEAMGLSP
jgi:glycosyltransferase involved in cell wall biosynthesis